MTENYLIACVSEETSKMVQSEMKASKAIDLNVAKRRNLSGDAATWIVTGTLAVNALPHILTFLKGVLDGKRITRFKIGEFEVENPTQEVIDKLIALREKELSKNDTKAD